MDVVRARTLKCFQVELYPTQVSKRIVWSVARSTRDDGAAMLLLLTSTTRICKAGAEKHTRAGEWRARGGTRTVDRADTVADAAGAAATGAAASGIADATGVARTTERSVIVAQSAHLRGKYVAQTAPGH